MAPLAVLEVFHSRTVAPTRRVALGRVELPMDPAAAYGAALLGAVTASFVVELDREVIEEYLALLAAVEAGERIVQPQLRYRFQHDRVGLTRSRHRLCFEGERFRFDIDHGLAAPEQHLLAAAYACAPMPAAERARAIDALEFGLTWRGPLDRDFFVRLSNHHGESHTASPGSDDAWARRVLGIAPHAVVAGDVVRHRFREGVRAVHPDHGAESTGAAERLADLARARRILLS